MSDRLRLSFRNLTAAEDQWRRPSDLLRLLADTASVQVVDPQADNFFVYGSEEPGPSFTDRPWIRRDDEGRPLGVWVYYKGSWIKSYSYDVGQKLVFSGSTTQIQPPFYLADGNNGTTDMTDHMTPTGNHSDYDVGYMEYRGYT